MTISQEWYEQLDREEKMEVDYHLDMLMQDGTMRQEHAIAIIYSQRSE